MRGDLKNGSGSFKIDDHDSRDFIVVANKKTQIPHMINLQNHCPPIKSDKQIASSITHTVLSALYTMVNIDILGETNDKYVNKYRKHRIRKSSSYYEMQHYMKNDYRDSVSERSLFNIITKNKKNNNITFREVLTAMYHSPHLTVDKKNDKSVGIYKINEYARIQNSGKNKNIRKRTKRKIIKDMKIILSSGIPIIGSIFMVKPLGKINKTDGFVNYTIKEKKYGSYQSVLIVGYNDSPTNSLEGYFIFKNSWGNQWGNKGYGYVSYDEILNNKIGDMYIISKFSFDYYSNSGNKKLLYDVSSLNLPLFINKNNNNNNNDNDSDSISISINDKNINISIDENTDTNNCVEIEIEIEL